MALLPDRHPQRDFFVLDIADVVPKDDTASMEHPLFSLATKPDMRHLEYRSGGNVLKIRPSGLGLPTIKDKDVLIFCISQFMHKKNRGEKIGNTVRFSARELSIATNRQIGGDHYKRLENAFSRLQGTQFLSNIQTGNKVETKIFSLVDQAGFVRTADERFRVDYCEVVLSDWLMRAIEADEIVTISNGYFRLRRPLERRLYEIARKHCGNQPRWQIGLAKLQEKTGSNAPLKKFRLNIRQIIADDHIPFYHMELTKEDLVIFRPRDRKHSVSTDITIKEWATEKARQIAREKGWDYHASKLSGAASQQNKSPKETRPKMQAQHSSPTARKRKACDE
jgi:plasmid replication initiation protein